MEYLVFKSTKSGNRIVVPAEQSLVIARKDSTVVYAIGGSGKERMVWEVSSLGDIAVYGSMGEALGCDTMKSG